jgi:hypothetical protein
MADKMGSLATSDYTMLDLFLTSIYIFSLEKKKSNLLDTFGRVEHLQYQGQDQH